MSASAWLQQLTAQGDQVDGLVRRESKGRALKSHGIATTPGDLVAISVPDLTGTLRGVDAIVFTAGAGGKDGPEATDQADGD